MTEPYSDPQHERGQSEGRNQGRGNFRGGRGGPGNRDNGGFRIRLSDNEMRSARSLQEAFNLRSTVAVLGFAIRTLGQMLEDGKLEQLVEEQRQLPKGGGKRGDRPQGARGGRFDDQRKAGISGSKPNPFARPPKPETQIQKEEDSPETITEEPMKASKTIDPAQPTDSTTDNLPEGSEGSEQASPSEQAEDLKSSIEGPSEAG